MGPMFWVLLVPLFAVLALILLALPAPNVQAQEEETVPTISLSATSGIVGKRIRITGTGFSASENFSVLFDGETAGNAFTSDTGSLFSTISVPTKPGGV